MRKLGIVVGILLIFAGGGIAATPTPVLVYTQRTDPWACGNVTGLLGYVPAQSVKSTLSAGYGLVSAKYGHQVSGSQCGPASANVTTPNTLGLTFTRPSNNGLTYRLKKANVKMTGKKRNRRSVDMSNCSFGPPTWAPTVEHKADRATVTWRRSDGSTAGSITHGIAGDGGKVLSPVIPHASPTTDVVATSASQSVTIGGGAPTVTSMPPAYQDDGPTEALDASDDNRWRPENLSDPNNPNRSTFLDVATRVTVKLASSATEITVPWDNSESTVTLEAKIQ